MAMWSLRVQRSRVYPAKILNFELWRASAAIVHCIASSRAREDEGQGWRMQQRTDQLVLMTPDSESGKAVYPRAAQILAPIPLCFHSPANSPSPAPSSPSNMSSLEHVDVVQSLVEWQVPEVAKQILEYLSTEDLLSYVLYSLIIIMYST